jgi:membrane protein
MPALAERNIELRAQELVGEQGAVAVKQVIDASSGMGRSTWAVIVGAVTFMLGASMVFGELQAALNTIWDVRANPGQGMIFEVLWKRLRSFGIALTAGILLVASLMISAAIDNLHALAMANIPGASWFWRGADAAVSFAVVVVLFAMIYKYLPDVRLAWRDVWTGATVTGVLFAVGKYGIGIYLGHTAIGGTFGTAGSLAVLLVWVYYSALICLFGAEFTCVHARRRGRRIDPKHVAIRVGKKSHNR